MCAEGPMCAEGTAGPAIHCSQMCLAWPRTLCARCNPLLPPNKPTSPKTVHRPLPVLKPVLKPLKPWHP